jgi:hypothetical protein
MKTISYAAAALAATLATASAHDVAKPGLAYDTKDAKVTLVYEHPPCPTFPARASRASSSSTAPAATAPPTRMRSLR